MVSFRQEINPLFNNIKKALILIAIFFWYAGCTEKIPATHLVFVDYSLSTPIFIKGNSNRLLDQIKQSLKQMNAGDRMVVYPIHLASSTAAPIIRFIKPLPNGDLNDRNNAMKENNNFIQVLKGILIEPGIRRNIRLKTNIYPIIHKINRYVNEGPVFVKIFSDMKHEFSNENFDELFGPLKKDPDTYAKEIFELINPKPLLSNCAIKILIPGLSEGEMEDELIRNNIILFWEKLFRLTGSKVNIQDL